jgi:CheY-like chemotaxis protein
MLKYRKIVLVDDDTDDRQIFEEILSEIDPEAAVECAENGLEMIALLDRLPDDQLPEMIILDQNMPQMTGKESLIYLKATSRFRDIPVIVYSTYQIRDFYRECLELGAQDVVPKPDTLQAYRDMIHQFLVIRPSLPGHPSAPSGHPSTSSGPGTPSASSGSQTELTPYERESELTPSGRETELTPLEPVAFAITPSAPETPSSPPIAAEALASPSSASEALTPPPSPASEEQTPLPKQ